MSQLNRMVEPVAVVGLAIWTPGARDIEDFWHGLVDGRPPAPAIPDTDPVRRFLAVCQDALTHAGYDPGAMPAGLAVFGTAGRGNCLSTIEIACQALQRGTCHTALAGGSAALADTDTTGTGTGGSEGAVATVLKRLDDAYRDGDEIRALILGSAVDDSGNHDVQLTPPDRGGQATVRRAMAVAGLAPTETSYPVMAADRAGVASLATAVLALEREAIPVPPPASAGGVRRWPRDSDRRRIVGVTATPPDGVGVHVILTEGPPAVPEPFDPRPRIVLWSASSAADERRLRPALARFFAGPGRDRFADSVATLQHGRAWHPVRAATVCTTAEQTAAALAGSPGAPALLTGAGAVERACRVAFLVPGSDAGQLWLARGSYGTVREFTVPMDECIEAIEEHGGQLYKRWWNGVTAADLADPAFVQPLRFAIAYSLAAMWRRAGVVPVAVLGCGIGELAAAAITGAFPLPEAARLVVDWCTRREADPPTLRRAARPRPPHYSAHAGGAVDPSHLAGPGFWRAALTGPGRVHAGLGALLTEQRPTVLLELGPPSDLGTLVRRHPDRAGAVTVASSGDGTDDQIGLLTAAGRLWVAGCPIDWAALDQPPPLRRVAVPSHPAPGRAAPPPGEFRPRSTRSAESARVPDGTGTPALATPPAKTGDPGLAAAPGAVWERELSDATDWALDEHRLGPVPLLPATALLDLMVRAYHDIVGQPAVGAIIISDVVFRKPLLDRAPRLLRIAFHPGPDRFTVEVGSQPASGGGWRGHASARIGAATSEPDHVDVERLRTRFVAAGHTEPIPSRAPGLTLGPRWHGITECRRLADELLLRVELPQPYHPDLAEHVLHPALLDCVLAAMHGPDQAGPLQPHCRRLVLSAPLPASFHAHLRHRDDPSCGRADLVGDDGRLLVRLDGLAVSTLDAARRGALRQ